MAETVELVDESDIKSESDDENSSKTTKIHSFKSLVIFCPKSENILVPGRREHFWLLLLLLDYQLSLTTRDTLAYSGMPVVSAPFPLGLLRVRSPSIHKSSGQRCRG